MWKKIFGVINLAFATAATFCGLNTYATAGNAATIAGGEWDICIAMSGSYSGSSFVADVAGTNFASQIVYGDFSNEACRTIKLATGNNYTVTMNKPMGVNSMSYSTDGNKLTFSATIPTVKYLNIYGGYNVRNAASEVEVSFNNNGGSGAMSTLPRASINSSITLPLNTMTRTDYKFDGWNTASDGTGTRYEDGDTITITDGGEVELFAQWAVDATTLKSGTRVNEALKTLANGTSVGYTSDDSAIKYLEFVSALPNTVDQNTPKVNIALDGEVPVYAYWVASEEKIYINTEVSKIYANASSDEMFGCMKALTSLDLPASFDTSKATSMTGMFRSMESLTSLTLSDSFNTSSVRSMGSMFQGLKSLTSLTLPASFDTSSVESMGYMFYWSESLTTLNLPASFDTSKVESMTSMFNGMKALRSLTLPANFNTSRVENMDNMFSGMKALTSLTLPASFDTSRVNSMKYMFSDMEALASLSLPASFNTSSVTNMQWMFQGLKSLTSLTLPVNFNTSLVRNMRSMFSGMSSLTTLTLPDSFVIASGTDTTYIFLSSSASTATLYATDATIRSLWPGTLGN